MSLKDDLERFVEDSFSGVWTRREGQKVPETDHLTLKNDALDLEATVLYADLADSTGLVKNRPDWFAAKVYKTFLYCAAKIIRDNDGSVTAYDGDRVMGVFIGASKNSNAAKAALQIRWAVGNIVSAKMNARYTENKFVLKHKVGIDTSKVMVARTGIRGSNDLVWVGNAANNAAKLAALDRGYTTYISAETYSRLAVWAKMGGDPKRSMWVDLGSGALGYRIYGSTWRWRIK